MPPKFKHAGHFKGVVLAGGMSRRFGSDKALARIHEQTMLELQVDCLRTLELETVVITRPGRDYGFAKCRVEYDEIPDQGPLGGLYTACGIFANASLVVLTCDMPDTTKTLVQSLLSLHRPTSPATVFFEQKKWEPFPGIYESSLREEIRRRLLNKSLSMHSLLDSFKDLNAVPCPDRALFSNINTPQELEQRAAQRH